MKAVKNTVASDRKMPICRSAKRRYIRSAQSRPDQMASPYRME